MYHDSKGPIWIHHNQKIQNRYHSLLEGFFLHFGQSWSMVRRAWRSVRTCAAAFARARRSAGHVIGQRERTLMPI